MRGIRLFIGFIVMGIAVPAILFFFLELGTLGELFTVSATCFLAWGIADLAAGILERPRLEGRTPRSAIREIDVAQSAEKKNPV
ncbi:MAG TPA: hypothetical protein VLV48_00100 [Thermoanaerobaculia bacterium]|nr:hypothetical protein [Thermoanaerobaculia bacterium]